MPRKPKHRKGPGKKNNSEETPSPKGLDEERSRRESFFSTNVSSKIDREPPLPPPTLMKRSKIHRLRARDLEDSWVAVVLTSIEYVANDLRKK